MLKGEQGMESFPCLSFSSWGIIPEESKADLPEEVLLGGQSSSYEERNSSGSGTGSERLNVMSAGELVS